MDTSEFGDVEVVDDTPDRDSLDALLENQAPLVDPRTAKFFITISRRTAFRRLRMLGCFAKPSHCMEVRFLDEVQVDEFDSICRACKKKMLQESGKKLVSFLHPLHLQLQQMMDLLRITQIEAIERMVSD